MSIPAQVGKEAAQEQGKIKKQWDNRDRAAIHSYPQLLALRQPILAQLACSAAVSAIRTALQEPFHFNRWLHRHAIATSAAGSSENAHWTLYATSAPRGTSAATSGWGSGGGWDNVPRGRDPAWDGVTRVAKMSQKNKQRRRIKREARAARAEWDAAEMRHQAELVRQQAGFLPQCH
ncbi:hypothetical protein B0H11DRAFT_2262041 [Mycena galericulata]|nr:hypothetical protein B0H11DRAFT_2262041 [Mycena galericulata]